MEVDDAWGWARFISGCLMGLLARFAYTATAKRMLHAWFWQVSIFTMNVVWWVSLQPCIQRPG